MPSQNRRAPATPVATATPVSAAATMRSTESLLLSRLPLPGARSSPSIQNTIALISVADETVRSAPPAAVAAIEAPRDGRSTREASAIGEDCDSDTTSSNERVVMRLG